VIVPLPVHGFYLSGNLFFGCTDLAVPNASAGDPNAPSLTTLVKRQVSAVASSSMDFSPLLYNIMQYPSSVSTPSTSSDSALHRRVEAKLADGDVMGAVRLASSNDTLAPFSLMIRHYLPFNLNIHLLQTLSFLNHLMILQRCCLCHVMCCDYSCYSWF